MLFIARRQCQCLFQGVKDRLIACMPDKQIHKQIQALLSRFVHIVCWHLMHNHWRCVRQVWCRPISIQARFSKWFLRSAIMLLYMVPWALHSPFQWRKNAANPWWTGLQLLQRKACSCSYANMGSAASARTGLFALHWPAANKNETKVSRNM